MKGTGLKDMCNVEVPEPLQHVKASHAASGFAPV